MRVSVPCGLLILLSFANAQISYGEYSEHRSRQALNMAAAAYSSEPVDCLEYTFPHKGYRVVARDERICDRKGNLCLVFVAVSNLDRTIIVSFRGTATSKQLKLEAVESLKPESNWYGFGLVDRYFHNALDYLWPSIEPTLREVSTSSYRVFFTGHSLGGALATLSTLKAYSLRLREPDLMHLFTFGEPRVGNKVLANNVDRLIANSWRVVHAGDMVPHLPPCKNAKGNKKGCDSEDHRRAYHHGTEVWYPHGMTPGASYKICTKDDEDWECSDGLGKWKINDHYYYFDVMVSSHGAAGCKPTTKGTLVSFCSLALMLSLFVINC